MFMGYLVEIWRAFADWAASQPLLVQLVVGSTLLLIAYILFVIVLSKLTAPPREPVRERFRSTR